MLGANVRQTGSRAGRAISLSLLRRGRNPGGRGAVRLVPLFVGVSRVVIRKRFAIKALIEQAVASLPALYARHLRAN